MKTLTKNYTVVQLILSDDPRHYESKECIHLEYCLCEENKGSMDFLQCLDRALQA